MDWNDALDAFEQRLRCQEAVVAGGGAGNTPVPELPVPDGELPEDLVLRAAALLDRCRQLEDLAARQLAELQAAAPLTAAATSPYARPEAASGAIFQL